MGANVRVGVLTFVTDQGIGPVELGVGLEDRGFESLFLAEHSHIPVMRRRPIHWAGRFHRSTTGLWIHSWR